MPAISYDILIEQGALWSQQFLWKDSDGVPIDVSAYTARMQVRRHFDDTSVEIELTTEDGRIVLGADGTITLTIVAGDTSLLPYFKGFYDLELIPPGPDGEDNVRRLVEGEVTVSREVTR